MANATKQTPDETLADAVAEIEALEAELAQLIQRQEQDLPKELEDVRARIQAAHVEMDGVNGQVDALRAERQKTLAVGGDVTTLNKNIQAIRARREIAEDLIVGLEARVLELQAEDIRLASEAIPQVKRKIAELRLRPIAADYNATAAKLAELTKAIYRIVNAYGFPFSPLAAGVLGPTDWNAFDVVPRLNWLGERGLNFFEKPSFDYQERQAQKA